MGRPLASATSCAALVPRCFEILQHAAFGDPSSLQIPTSRPRRVTRIGVLERSRPVALFRNSRTVLILMWLDVLLAASPGGVEGDRLQCLPNPKVPCACFRCVVVASLHTSMHTGARRRSSLSSTQPLPPPPVWHDGDLINHDGEQHTDRRERFTRQGRNRDCDARMSRDSSKGEHRAVVFIGSGCSTSPPRIRNGSTSTAPRSSPPTRRCAPWR